MSGGQQDMKTPQVKVTARVQKCGDGLGFSHNGHGSQVRSQLQGTRDLEMWVVSGVSNFGPTAGDVHSGPYYHFKPLLKLRPEARVAI